MLRQLAEEERLAKELGVTLGVDPAIQQTIAEVKNPDMPGAKPAAGDAEDAPTDSEDDSEDAAGDRRSPVTLIRRHGT